MRIEAMTIEQLVHEYNSFEPVEPIAVWTGSRQALIDLVRIARKQATSFGVLEGVSITLPE